MSLCLCGSCCPKGKHWHDRTQRKEPTNRPRQKRCDATLLARLGSAPSRQCGTTEALSPLCGGGTAEVEEEEKGRSRRRGKTATTKDQGTMHFCSCALFDLRLITVASALPGLGLPPVAGGLGSHGETWNGDGMFGDEMNGKDGETEQAHCASQHQATSRSRSSKSGRTFHIFDAPALRTSNGFREERDYCSKPSGWRTRPWHQQCPRQQPQPE